MACSKTSLFSNFSAVCPLLEPLTDRNWKVWYNEKDITSSLFVFGTVVAYSNISMNHWHSLHMWWIYNLKYNECISQSVYVGFILSLNWYAQVSYWPPLITVVINIYLNSITLKLFHLRWKSIFLNTWKS